jgi:hypothetical protein
VVQLPTAGITFQPSGDKKTYYSDFTVLVRFKDEDKQIVQKMSQRYELRGPIDQIDRAKGGEVIFYREAELPPGGYAMETVVHDALSKKASVRLGTFDQAPVNVDALRVSSLLLVRRSERVSEQERSPDGPLYVGNTVLYPNLGDPLVKGTDKELGFYFVVYPGQGGGPAPSASLELVQDGQSLAKVPLQLAVPAADGRIQQVSRIPIEALPPGSYELRVAVQQGGQPEVRSATFRVTAS